MLNPKKNKHAATTHEIIIADLLKINITKFKIQKINHPQKKRIYFKKEQTTNLINTTYIVSIQSFKISQFNISKCQQHDTRQIKIPHLKNQQSKLTYFIIFKISFYNSFQNFKKNHGQQHTICLCTLF